MVKAQVSRFQHLTENQTILPFLHIVSNAAQCQAWPFNGPFWNSVGYLYDFQVLPQQKHTKTLASTCQPIMKLVIETASAILLCSLILLPMPPNASPGLSMGHFGTVWATCMISKCCHYKMAGLNLSTHHEIGDWASICHPFVFLDASPGLSLGHFIHSVACIWRHWKQNQGTQKDGRCCLNHQFHDGLTGWGQRFCMFLLWQHLEITQVAHTIPKLPIERPGLALGGIGNKWRNAKKLSMFSHGTGLGSLSEVVPPPEASLIKWSVKNNLDHGCTAKTWTNLDRFQLQLQP